MESNECICINNIIKAIQQMITSICTTTATVMMNTNTPATDSGYIRTATSNTGYINTNSKSNTSPGDISLSTGFYSFLVIAALLLLVSAFKKVNKKSISCK